MHAATRLGRGPRWLRSLGTRPFVQVRGRARREPTADQPTDATDQGPGRVHDAAFTRTSLDVLVVEDDPTYLEFLEQVLGGDRRTRFRVTVATSLEAALEQAAARDHDAVLVDLGLPDSKGLGTVRQFLEADLDAALLVVSASDDDQLAREAIGLGAQEYLAKGEVTPELVVRALRYAVDRQRLVNEVRDARRGEARERELRRVERLAGDHPLRATAAMYGNEALADRDPARSDDLRREYARLLDEALEVRVFDAPPPTEDLRSMAAVLGFLGATPRDVVSLHTAALRGRLAASGTERAQAYLEEARVSVLELMGHLTSWYRNRAMGQSSPRPSGPDDEPHDAEVTA